MHWPIFFCSDITLHSSLFAFFFCLCIFFINEWVVEAKLESFSCITAGEWLFLKIDNETEVKSRYWMIAGVSVVT